MARNKRMFSCDVVDADKFLDMPVSARCLYYDLGMRADDDGFISPKKILRLTGASEDDLKVLIAKDFVIPFETGVIVIKDWKLNNYLRKDRYFKTKYTKEMSRLSLTDNGSYCIKNNIANPGIPSGIPLGTPRREENRIEENRREENRREENRRDTIPKKRSVSNLDILLKEETILELSKSLDLDKTIVQREVEKMVDWLKSKGKRYKDYKAFARNWLRKLQPEDKPKSFINENKAEKYGW